MVAASRTSPPDASLTLALFSTAHGAAKSPVRVCAKPAGPTGIASGVGVLVGVLVGVDVGVSVGVLVGVFVGVSVGVDVGASVGVSVAVAAGVSVASGVAVSVGVLVAKPIGAFCRVTLRTSGDCITLAVVKSSRYCMNWPSGLEMTPPFTCAHSLHVAPSFDVRVQAVAAVLAGVLASSVRFVQSTD